MRALRPVCAGLRRPPLHSIGRRFTQNTNVFISIPVVQDDGRDGDTDAHVKLDAAAQRVAARACRGTLAHIGVDQLVNHAATCNIKLVDNKDMSTLTRP
jgi:hypothetical protein